MDLAQVRLRSQVLYMCSPPTTAHSQPEVKLIAHTQLVNTRREKGSRPWVVDA